jgi:SulP family sulfate permease
MLATYTIQYNGIGVLPYLSLLSACMIFVIYMLNLQPYLMLMPTAVFEGFTLAVALIIGLNQLNMAFDLQPVGPKHEHFYENVIESLKTLDELSWAPAITFVLLTVLLLSLVKWVPKVKGRPIPWTVIIPLLTIVLGYLSDSDNLGGVHIPTLKDKYGELKARVVVPPEQSLEHYAQGNYLGVFTAAFGIAFVAVLETLISAKIAEQKTGWGFDPSRETLGIMICHAVCGAVGAMPPTGVFVRTALNFSLGATHKMSQVVNALAVLVISVVVMPVFSYLPQSSVAALLIFASVRMAPVHYMVDLWKTDKGGLGLLVITCLICVFTDPVYGLILGMVFALLRDASQTALAESRLSFYSGETDGENQVVFNEETDQPPSMTPSGKGLTATCTVEVDLHDSRLSLRSSPATAILGSLARSAMKSQRARTPDGTVLDEASDSVVVYEPVGPLIYLTHEKHQARLKVLLERQPKALVVSLDLTSRVDKDGSDALGKAMKQIAEKGLRVELCLPAALENTVVGKAAWVEELQAVGHVHRRRLDALRAARTVTDASEASKAASPRAERAQSEEATLASDV